MANCTDCIHYEVCQALEDNYQASKIHPVQCGCYEDKSLYVKLPCKVGDAVYAISESRIKEGDVIEISMFPETHITLEIRCDYDCDECPFADWSQNYGGDYSCSSEYGTSCVKGDDFGKTVFLTREEAEKALKERVKNG